MVRYDLSARAAPVLRECLAACAVTTRIMRWSGVAKGHWRIHGRLAGWPVVFGRWFCCYACDLFPLGCLSCGDLTTLPWASGGSLIGV